MEYFSFIPFYREGLFIFDCMKKIRRDALPLKKVRQSFSLDKSLTWMLAVFTKHGVLTSFVKKISISLIHLKSLLVNYLNTSCESLLIYVEKMINTSNNYDLAWTSYLKFLILAGWTSQVSISKIQALKSFSNFY